MQIQSSLWEIYERVVRFFVAFPYKKYIAAFLIFALLLSQTIRFESPVVNAQAKDYLDIVSFVVDSETYKAIGKDIDLYAKDIQQYLGSTQVAIILVDPDTAPYVIATKNEELYYEGFDDVDNKKAGLVGTILIGNVPIPMVEIGGKHIPSLFPYTDFDHKTFIYNPKTDYYEKNMMIPVEMEAVDIWHGVINPALGRKWEDSDREKISKFLQKTHYFYQKKAKFAKNPLEPRVFYYDGWNEYKSMTPRTIFQHEKLHTENIENFAYKRYSKYLLKDLNERLKKYDKEHQPQDMKDIMQELKEAGQNNEDLDDWFPSETLDFSPDVQTPTGINELQKTFGEIFNKNSISKEVGAIRNAGRYSSGSILRADMGPITIPILDKIGQDTIKVTNDAIEKSIKKELKERNMIRKMPILLGSSACDNYYFGRKGKDVKIPEDCTIARGSREREPTLDGRGILVESNLAFDVIKLRTVQIAELMKDKKRCFRKGKPKIDTFWGNNSLLWLAFLNGEPPPKDPIKHVYEKSRLKVYAKPLFTRGGMLETDRAQTELQEATIDNCDNPAYRYMLIQKKYRCDDPLLTCPSPKRFFEEYSGPMAACKDFEIVLDGRKIQMIPDYCANQNNSSSGNGLGDSDDSGGGGGGVPALNYKTVEGLLEHISPTNEEIDEAKKTMATPNLAIDMNRYLEFMTRKGNIAKIYYPNFFRIPEDIDSIESLREWIRKDAEKQWKIIIDLEAVTDFPPFKRLITEQFLGNPIPPEFVDWNDFIDDRLLAQILRSHKWLHYSVAEKYDLFVQAMLSYSHRYDASEDDTAEGFLKNVLPKVPNDPNQDYEIAYIAPTKIRPGTEDPDLQVGRDEAAYDTGIRKINAVNMTEPLFFGGSKIGESLGATAKDMKSYAGGESNTDACAPPGGVNILKWPGAIMCWTKNISVPKVATGTCGGSGKQFDIFGEKKSTTDINTAAVGNKLMKEKEETAKQEFMKEHAANIAKKPKPEQSTTPSSPSKPSEKNPVAPSPSRGLCTFTDDVPTSKFPLISFLGKSYMVGPDKIGNGDCSKENDGGYTDWKLPNIEQLRSIEYDRFRIGGFGAQGNASTAQFAPITRYVYNHTDGTKKSYAFNAKTSMSPTTPSDKDHFRCIREAPQFKNSVDTLARTVIIHSKRYTLTGIKPKRSTAINRGLFVSRNEALGACQYGKVLPTMDQMRFMSFARRDVNRIINVTPKFLQTPDNLNIFFTKDANMLGKISFQDGQKFIEQYVKDSGEARVYCLTPFTKKVCDPQVLDKTFTNDVDASDPSYTYEPPTKTEFTAEQTKVLEKAKVRIQTQRPSMGFFEKISIEAGLFGENDTRIVPTHGTVAKLHILGVRYDQGKSVPKDSYNEFFQTSPLEFPISGSNAKFSINTKNKEFGIIFEVVYRMSLADGTVYEITSEPHTLRAQSTGLDAYLQQNNKTVVSLDGKNPAKIFVYAKDGKTGKRSDDEISKKANADITITIRDEITNEVLVQQQKITGDSFEIPESIWKKSGVYHAIMTNNLANSGELVFAVQAGKLQKVKIVPESPAIVSGTFTKVDISLLDDTDNLIAPNLHRITIIAEGGEILDSLGNGHKTLSLDLLEPRVTIKVRSDNVSENMTITAKVDESGPEATEKIETHNDVKVGFIIEGDISAGGDAHKTKIKVTSNGELVKNFSSTISWTLPQGVGTFDRKNIEIVNGESEIFSYTPGTTIGEYPISFHVPGIGVLTDKITVKPGIPMYINHREDERKKQLIFTVRDRYGNKTDFSGKGTLKISNKEPNMDFSKKDDSNFAKNEIVAINFTKGEYIRTLKNATYTIEAPELEGSLISYEDVSGVHYVNGVPKYVARVFTNDRRYNFYPDYNARYTIMPGGSYLREGEDILFHSIPEKSQSLAVSTLLDSPYLIKSQFAVFPDGHFVLGTGQASLFQTDILLQDGYPNIQVFDGVLKKKVADVTYIASRNEKMIICTTEKECAGDRKKDRSIQGQAIAPGYFFKKQGGVLQLFQGVTPIVQIQQDGKMQINPGVTLHLAEKQLYGLHFGIALQGVDVAEVKYFMDASTFVARNETITTASNGAPQIVVYDLLAQKFDHKTLAGETSGYQLMDETGTQNVDEEKNGPKNIESIGRVNDITGVGWKDDNRILLSYAAGDTVGESTKWFQTYIFVNMGDPVAHVDQGRKGTRNDGLDRTVGTQIADSRRSQIRGVFYKDMNNDGKKDIVVQYLNGYVELFLNLGNKFRSRGNIAYLSNVARSTIQVGDFFGDGFSDIIGITDDGDFRMINNESGRFTDLDMSVLGTNFIPKNIQQVKIYDMDGDGKDDIVYFSTNGELAVLYPNNKNDKAIFEKKILANDLGAVFQQDPTDEGGAIFADHVPQQSSEQLLRGKLPAGSIQTTLPGSSGSGTSVGFSNSLLQPEIYYLHTVVKEVETYSGALDKDATIDTLQRTYDQNSEAVGITEKYMNSLENKRIAGNTDKMNTGAETKTYIRSQYAAGVDMKVEKRYIQHKAGRVQPEDLVKVEISLTNTSKKNITHVQYLDTLGEGLVLDPKLFTYDIIDSNNNKTEKIIQSLAIEDYHLEFHVGNIPAGKTHKIVYFTKVGPIKYGKIDVGKFVNPSGKTGDVAFKGSTICGDEESVYHVHSNRTHNVVPVPKVSLDEMVPSRISQKIRENQETQAQIQALESQTGATAARTKNQLKEKSQKILDEDLAELNSEKSDEFVKTSKNGKQNSSVEFEKSSSSGEKDSIRGLDAKVSEIFNGLSCGFGGNSCMQFPINMAPLAPGHDLTLFGIPVGDGLHPSEGLPLFSALTWMPIGVGCIPVTWPPSPLGAGCGATSAGGWLGTWDPTNVFRFFVTPTLTMGVGAAMCFGGPANSVGWTPPPGAFPYAPGGNCLVVTKAGAICGADGDKEDGDVEPVSRMTERNGVGPRESTWNSKSCTLVVNPKTSDAKKQEIKEKVVRYIKNPNDTNRHNALEILSKNKGYRTPSDGKLVSAGVNLHFEVGAVSDPGDVIDVRNKRIAGFPDFIMDWVVRQSEELMSSLFTPPNLTIIPPSELDQFGKVDKTFNNFVDEIGIQYSNAQSDILSTQGIQQIGGAGTTGGIHTMETIYNFISQMPYIDLQETRVPINIPWIPSEQELDQFVSKLEGYQAFANNRIQNYQEKISSLGSAEADISVRANLEASLSLDVSSLSAIQKNLSRIEEYRKFPEKLQKLISGKNGYLSQLACNIGSIERFIRNGIEINVVGFGKWARFFALIKSIAETWQPLLDIFFDTYAQCGTCHNERNQLQYWKYKLLSMIMIELPVITFPKWPDILVDLSDVRMNFRLNLPSFDIRLTPLRLPSLPDLHAGAGASMSADISANGSVGASASLPELPVLPPIPELPELPELPSLPQMVMVNIPSPPEIPKLSGVFKTTLSILKLIAKIYCYYKKTPFVPEWNVGDVIAQRTDRQNTLAFDFLDIHALKIDLPTTPNVEIATHVNLELDTDFIVEFAKNAVKPINAFGNDLQQLQYSGIEKGAQDAADTIQNVDSTIDTGVNVADTVAGLGQADISTPQSYALLSRSVASKLTQLQHDNTGSLDTDEFTQYFIDALSNDARGKTLLATLQKDLAAADLYADSVKNKNIKIHEEKFKKLQQVIDASKRENAQLQHIVDILERKETTPNTLAHYDTSNSIQLASNSHKNETITALQSLHAYQKNIQKDWLQNAKNPKDRGSIVETFQSSVAQLQKMAREEDMRIAQSSSTNFSYATPSNATSSDITASNTSSDPMYLPNFEGIYIITEPSKKQTRLFDYVDGVSTDMEVETFDIDQDGDKDHLFVLNGILYWKKDYTNNPDSQATNAEIKIFDITDDTDFPSVPNHVEEITSTPEEMTLTFRNATPGNREWKLEFYDHYMDWDAAAIGDNPHPVRRIDLFAEGVENPEYTEDGMYEAPIKRSLEKGYDQEGFEIRSGKIYILKNNRNNVIGAHQPIYVGNRDVKITYKNAHFYTPQQKTLKAHTQYQFNVSTEIYMEKGRIFLINHAGDDTQKTGPSREFEGLPVLPGMRITSPKDFEIRDTTNTKNPDNFKGKNGAQYLSQSVGREADRYEVVINYSNGLYYARLSDRNDGAVRSHTFLISPQKTSDVSAPLATELQRIIKVPVYTEHRVSLRDVIKEYHDFTVTIDDDLTLDTNKNGIVDDDFISSGKLFRIEKTESGDEIVFGPFNELGTHKMLAHIEDEFKNVTETMITIEVIAPVPEIHSVKQEEDTNTGLLRGALIDKKVADEPIHIIRERGTKPGELLYNDPLYTVSNGKFSKNAIELTGNILVTIDGKEIHMLPTGVPKDGILPQGFSMGVLPATDRTPMTFIFKNEKNQIVYRHILALPFEKEMISGTPKDHNEKNGLYVVHGPETSFVSAKYNDPNIPYGGYVVDSAQNPLLAISRDGSIYLADAAVQLHLEIYNNTFMKVVATKGGKEIASVVYHFYFFYTE